MKRNTIKKVWNLLRKTHCLLLFFTLCSSSGFSGELDQAQQKILGSLKRKLEPMDCALALSMVQKTPVQSEQYPEVDDPEIIEVKLKHPYSRTTFKIDPYGWTDQRQVRILSYKDLRLGDYDVNEVHKFSVGESYFDHEELVVKHIGNDWHDRPLSIFYVATKTAKGGRILIFQVTKEGEVSVLEEIETGYIRAMKLVKDNEEAPFNSSKKGISQLALIEGEGSQTNLSIYTIALEEADGIQIQVSSKTVRLE